MSPGHAIYESLVDGTGELAEFFVVLARLKTARGIEKIAYLIGNYLVFQYRIRESSENFDQPWKIATILQRSCVPIEQDANHYLEFREQIDAAFDKLKEEGVCDDWQYVDTDTRMVQGVASAASRDHTSGQYSGTSPIARDFSPGARRVDCG